MVDYFSDDLYYHMWNNFYVNEVCDLAGFRCSEKVADDADVETFMSKKFWNNKNEVLSSSQQDCDNCKQIGNAAK